MNNPITPASLAIQHCDYLFSDECLSTNVNGGRLKRNSNTKIIPQYPYEFVCKNAGLCWVQEGMACDHFERHVLPHPVHEKGDSAIIKKYEKMRNHNKKQVLRLCECGVALPKRRRYCQECSEKRRRKSDRENHRKHRGKASYS
jgi:hypothetical protein